MKPLKEREFFKSLRACDVISDLMEKETGLIKDFERLEIRLKEILD